MPFEQSLGSTAISAGWYYPPRRQQAATAFSSAVDSWSDSVGDRLAQLLKFTAGWDGHTGRPISPTVAVYAYYLVPRLMRPGTPPPFVAPLASGGVQLEWHRNGWDLEIEIKGPGQLYAYARELATGREWEADMTDDLGQLQPKLDAIAG
jgi:hypothetical protein